MTRRHFQMIAQVFRRASLDPALHRPTVETVARSFTVELAKENERFDPERFLDLALPPIPARPRPADPPTRCVA